MRCTSSENRNKVTSNNNLSAFFLIVLALFCHNCLALKTFKPANGAKISIESPLNGAIVSTNFKLKFSATRMSIMPADIPHTDSGHYHLLVDNSSPIKIGEASKLPHSGAFEKGQREGSLTLTPGQHTLQLLLVDHLHRPHNPPLLSEKISVTVIAPILPKSSKNP